MKKLIIDFDSTLVKVEALDMLAEESLIQDKNKDEVIGKIKKITQLGMNGDLSFAESLNQRIVLIKTNQAVIEKTANLIKKEISRSILENLDFFKKNAKNILIISGGFKKLIMPTAKIMGIARGNIFANDFVFNDDGNLIGINKKNLMAQDNGKVSQLKALNLKGELVMVGDGWTDYEAKKFGVVDKFIAYTENVFRKKVVEKADLVADNFEKVIKFF